MAVQLTEQTVDQITLIDTTGTPDTRDIVAKLATHATNDVEGRLLTSYICNVERDNSNGKILFRKGSGDTISSDNLLFQVGKVGFVPAPTSNDSTKVLQGNGTWVQKSLVTTVGVSAGKSLKIDGIDYTIPYATSAGSANNGIASLNKSGNNYTIRLVNGTQYQITDTNTTYSAGTGLSLNGTQFNNTGVTGISVQPGSHYLDYVQNGESKYIDIQAMARNATYATELVSGYPAGSPVNPYIYRGDDGSIIFNTWTGMTITFQADGNLVLRRNGTIYWDAFNTNRQIRSKDPNHKHDINDAWGEW